MSETFLRESTKFRMSPAPIQVPGTCASCGSSSTDDRDYVDFGMTVDFVGVIYFCTFCFTECANALGWISPEQARNMEELLEVTEKKVVDFYTKDRALNDAVRVLRDSGLFDLVESNDPAPVAEVANKIDRSPIQDDTRTDKSELDPSEQDSKQGSSDLPATGSDDWLSKLEL